MLIIALLFADHNKKLKREKEEAEFNQRYEIEQKAAEVQKQLQSYEDLKRIKDSIDKRLKEDKYENEEEKQKDITSAKQLELWVSEAKRNIKEVQIAWDALTVIVNPTNKIKQLTREQLEGIFTGKITNWKEVGGADLRVRSTI